MRARARACEVRMYAHRGKGGKGEMKKKIDSRRNGWTNSSETIEKRLSGGLSKGAPARKSGARSSENKGASAE